MPVAVFQEWDEELAREPEHIPKLGRRVLPPRRHSGAEAAEKLLQRWPGEPPIRLDRHDLALPLHEAQKRHDVPPVADLELRRARRLTPRPAERSQQVAAQVHL